MRLGQLLMSVPEALWDPALDGEVNDVRDDSRAVRPGDLFVAVPGTVADGRRFLYDAIQRGASAVVIERPGGAGTGEGGAAIAAAAREGGFSASDGAVPSAFRGAVVTVPDARHALAVISANRFSTARDLTLTAVTGTNGKTTTTYLLESMWAAAGHRAGVVGTIAYRLAAAGGGSSVDSLCQSAPLTTPGAPALHALFAEMRAAGASDVVLEASSQALAQSRLDGCRFAVAGLTNLTQDHLDHHGTMERYLDAKAILFERLLVPAKGVAVLPVDLPEGRVMKGRVAGGQPILGVASTPGAHRTDADVAVEATRMTADGIVARLATPHGTMEFSSPLIGDFNLANLVLAVGMGIARGLGVDAIVAGVGRLAGVPGRLERVSNDHGVLCAVDYAHTPDAVERAIAAVRPLVAPGGRLLTVFGCGGDRDRAKRPLMGQAAVRGSDLAIVTSDNPRGEDPQAIIAMIIEGVRGLDVRECEADELSGAPGDVSGRRCYHVAIDRRLAIQRAVQAARAGDVLLIAGKGHEDYQIVGAERLHFDDREEARAAFAGRAAGDPA